MSEPFIAEIRIFAGNFAPRGWAFCDGQLLPVSQNTALFSLVGTTYGGDGRSTMGLPDLQGRAPMHPGRGPGLTARRLGERGGVDTVTVTEAQLPNHNHAWRAAEDPADLQAPSPTRSMTRSSINAYTPAANPVPMASQMLVNNGGSQAHNNMQPMLTMNFIIALQGLYPSRS
jgi:microcystin-dependent protein